METMRYFPVIFSIVYIFSLFFCIFARIESWPFSDYRVFEGAYYPKDLVVRAPYFKLSNGEYFNPSTKEFYIWINRVYFHLAPLKLKPNEWEAYLKKLVRSKKVLDIVKKMTESGLKPEKFVVMKVTFREKRKHLWVPVYTPEKQYDISDTD